MTTEFGRRLKDARKKAGLTQKQLAPLAEMSQSNLSELETVAHGSAKTSQLAKACGVNAHWLATGDGSMDESSSQDHPIHQTAAIKVKPMKPGAVAAQLAASLVELPTSRRKSIASLVATLIETGPSDEEANAIDSLAPGVTLSMAELPNATQNLWRRIAFEKITELELEDQQLMQGFFAAVDAAVDEKTGRCE